jgi:hypothetical protein
MDHPWQLRIVSLVYSIGTIYFTFKCAQLFFGKRVAVTSVVFLCTVIPFYNFAAQIRGYSLSTFLLIALTYFVFRSYQTKKFAWLIIIIILTACLSYTIPLNLYALLSILIFLFADSLIALTSEFGEVKKGHLKKNTFIGTSIIIGLLISIIAYTPIFHQVFFNEYVVPSSNFSTTIWFKATARIFYYFLSHRYWLLPFLIGGFTGSLYYYFRYKKRKELSYLFYLFIMLLAPFLISFVSKSEAPDRAFINLVPFFAIAMAFPFGYFNIEMHRRTFILITVIGCIYCFAVISFEMKSVNKRLLNDINTSGRSMDIYYTYFSHYYKPLETVKRFKENYYDEPSVVIIHDSEPHGLPEYLNKFKIPNRDSSILDSALTSNKTVFLFTRYPNEIDNNLFIDKHKCSVKMVNSEISYHNIFELKYKNLP